MKTIRNRRQAGHIDAVEIMLVTAIIFLLVAIAIPNSVWEKGKQIKQRHICVWQLERLDIAKKVWVKQNPDTNLVCAMRDIVGVSRHLSKIPFCPSGGVYVLGARDDKPTCSWHVP